MKTRFYLSVLTLVAFSRLRHRTDHGHDDNQDAGGDHDAPGARSCNHPSAASGSR